MKTINNKNNLKLDKTIKAINKEKIERDNKNKKNIDKNKKKGLKKGDVGYINEDIAYNYNLDEIKDYLHDKYSGLCCYCESKFNFGAYSEIEHFYPKSIYPEYIIEIKNLHYSCPKCNRLKGDKSPGKEGTELINIYSPNFILDKNEKSFILPSYNVKDKFKYLYYYINKDNGKDSHLEGTISVFDLNGERKERIYLIEERIRVFNQVLKIAEMINKLISKKRISNYNEILDYLFQEFSDMMNDSAPYSTMIKNQFGKIYIKLYEKYEQLKRTRLNP